MIEGETVTPMLLARRFTINPVLVIVALVFWYWMWGVPGAILATPMLAVDQDRSATASNRWQRSATLSKADPATLGASRLSLG